MAIVSVHVGLDYHSESIRVCVMDGDGMELLNRKVPNSVPDVMDAIRSVEDVVRVKGVAIEACTGSADFATRLGESTGWTVRLAHAAAVHRLKQGPDKTDRSDAWHLANLIRVNYLPQVWLADEQTRQLRRLVRYRQSLVADAKDIKLRIRSILKEDGIAETVSQGAWTKAWLQWVGQISLPEQSRWIVDQQLDLLKQLQEKIIQVEKRMDEVTRDDEAVQTLRAEKEVGLVTAVMLRAVVGRFDRFRTGKQLSRYCGVTPCNASSGERQADSGLVQAGHDDLRAVLIQLAKRLPRHPRWKVFKERLGKKKHPNVVSAAIANRWVRSIHHKLVPKPSAAREVAA